MIFCASDAVIKATPLSENPWLILELQEAFCVDRQAVLGAGSSVPPGRDLLCALSRALKRRAIVIRPCGTFIRGLGATLFRTLWVSGASGW